MGFFDSLRNAISGEDKPKEFEATFVEPKLGMTLASGQQDQAIVKAVTEGGAATKAGVRAGDIVVSLNGAGPLKYADLIAVIGTAGRPVSLGFTRPASGAGDVSGTSGVVSSHAGTNGARGSSVGEGPLRRMQDLARRRANEIGGNSWGQQQAESSPPPPRMTEEEKAERREAALRAAESRTKRWDKKLNKGKHATQLREATNEVKENKFGESGNAETRLMVRRVKEGEARMAESMGYNPFEARLMGNTAARAAMAGGTAGGGVAIPSVPPPSSASPSAKTTAFKGKGHRLGGDSAAKAEEGWEEEEAELAESIGREIEEVLGSVLQQDPKVSLVAVRTMCRMMKNMSINSSEDKFKRIRLANANFNAKVGQVDGGIEVMIAAGFVLEDAGEEAFLQYGSCDPVPLRLRVAMRKLVQAEALLENDGDSR